MIRARMGWTFVSLVDKKEVFVYHMPTIAYEEHP